MHDFAEPVLLIPTPGNERRVQQAEGVDGQQLVTNRHLAEVNCLEQRPYSKLSCICRQEIDLQASAEGGAGTEADECKDDLQLSSPHNNPASRQLRRQAYLKLYQDACALPLTRIPVCV